MENPAEPATRGQKRAFASALAILLALSIPISLLAFNLNRVFFDPARIKALLTEQAIHSDLVPATMEWFSESRAPDQEPSDFDNLEELKAADLVPYINRSSWRAISDEMLTDEFVTGAIATTVDGAYSWIEGEDSVPDMVLDLEPLKSRAQGDHGLNAAVLIFDNLPTCTEDQIAAVAAPNTSDPTSMPIPAVLCKLPDPWLEPQITGFVSAFAAAISEIPSPFEFGDELSKVSGESGLDLEQLKRQIRLPRTLGTLSILLTLVSLLSIAALFFRTPWFLGYWIGIPTAAGGAIALLWALLGGPLVVRALSGGALSQLTEAMRVSVLRLIEGALAQVFGPMAIQALVIALFGIGLFALYAFQDRREALVRAQASAR